MLIDNIRLFTTIAEKGSLVAAAREAGLSPTTVSERLAALEAHYGVVLLNRTTRSISLTDEGRLLIDGSKAVLSEVDDLDARIRLGAESLSGPIRISAPVDIGRSILSDVIAEFTIEHPATSVELSLSDGYVDIVGQGFDMAFRFGPISDSTLRVRKLADVRRVVCAAPSYLEKSGTPRKPEDLMEHNCLVMRFGETLDNVWRFKAGGKSRSIVVGGDRIVNDGSLVRRWALQGHGIILKSELDVGDDIRKGRLTPLLQKFNPPTNPLQILFPPSKAQPKRVKAFADKISDRMKEQDF